MIKVDILVNGVITHADYDSALSSVRDPSTWINAFPHASGRPNGKVLPLKRYLSPVVLDNLHIVSLMPFVDNVGERIVDKTIAKFVYCAVVTLASDQRDAIDYAVQHGTWLLDPQGMYYTRPAHVGAFNPLLPPEARLS